MAQATGKVAVPPTAGYIDSRTSRSKALGDLDKNEKRDQMVTISVCIRKKLVNGVPIVCATVNRGYGMDGELPAEYTDMAKFRAMVNDMTEKVVSEMTDN